MTILDSRDGPPYYRGKGADLGKMGPKFFENMGIFVKNVGGSQRAAESSVTSLGFGTIHGVGWFMVTTYYM